MTNADADVIRKLIDTLNYHTHKYDIGQPEISDKDWDDMYFTLEKLEEDTGIIYPDSPTQNISYLTVSKLIKKEHLVQPMLSLAKTKDVSEIQKFVSNNEFVGMFKMDGLTCRLTYEKGELVCAETRGNGEIGEDVTHNALVIPSIPKKIGNYNLIIDGEIICTYSDFEKFKNDYKNPRNFASGSIRLLDAEEAATRNLTFVAWDVVQGFDNILTIGARLDVLKIYGFTVVPFVPSHLFNDNVVENVIKNLDAKTVAHNLYPIDGYVFKFNDVKYGKSLGRTDHHWNNAIAYKFYDEEYETKLKYIDYDVSRTGILTPVAVFEPIEIDGSVVERASLHNISIMEEILGEYPYTGEPVWVYKANMIIPQISKADKKDYGDIIAAGGCTIGLGGDYGVLCPICGGSTSIKISDSGVKVLYCDNEQCAGKLAQRIDHFCGKKGLDIKGISRATIEKLIDWGWIYGIIDIFKLQEKRTEWINKSGFGQASVDKLLSSIKSARTDTNLANFISGLGIPLVGNTIAKEIVKYYPTWKEFRDVVGGDWTEFEGFGPEISTAINKFDYTEADEIAEMLTFMIPETSIKKVQTAEGINFCITGKLTSGNWKNRDELKTYIESIGGKVTSSVTSKTNYLINNDATSNSSKNVTAQKLGVEIITEEEFINKFKNE